MAVSVWDSFGPDQKRCFAVPVGEEIVRSGHVHVDVTRSAPLSMLYTVSAPQPI